MKTKTAVLNGKPYAGNPHVRFDEGEVASAKPRRGSLLYKSLKLVAAVVVCAGSAMPALADDWTYSNNVLSDGNWTIAATLKSGNITVGAPTAGEGLLDLSKPCTGGTISAVGGSAFDGNANITGLVLPDRSFTIGTYAFRNCSNLKGKLSIGKVGRVTFSYSGGQRDAWAFQNTGIEDLEIGLIGKDANGVYGFSKGVFSGCTALTNITFTENCDIVNFGKNVFDGCTALKTVTPLLPETVAAISCFAFQNCPIEGALSVGAVKSVSFGNDSSGARQSYAFSGAQITNLVFGASQGAIGEAAGLFGSCTKLERIDILSETMTSFGSKTPFPTCSALKEINFTITKPTLTGMTSPGVAKKIRFTYPKTSTEWGDYVTGLGANLVAWDPESEDAAIYKKTFPDWASKTPIGYTSSLISGRAIWLVPLKTGADDDVFLGVQGDPVEVGAVSPAYTGTEFPQVEAGTVCTAPHYGEDGTTAWECIGYTLEKQNDDTSWSVVEEKGDRSVTVGADEGGTYRLTWKWQKVAYALRLFPQDESICTFAPAGTPFDGGSDIEGVYYASNTTVTVTMTPTSGGELEFLGWHGPVADEDRQKTVVDVTIEGVTDLVAYYSTPWTYAGGVLTDGYWAFNASGSAGALTISSIRQQAGGLSLLDLRKGTGGSGVTAIGGSVFDGNTLLKEVRLPDNVTTIGNYAFRNCLALTTVTPLLPATVTSIGLCAFQNAAVEGKLELGLVNKVSFEQDGSGARNSRAFQGTKINELVLGSIGDVLYAETFAGCTALTNLTFAESFNTPNFYYGCFDGCTALKTVTPFLPDCVTFIEALVFQNCPVEGKLSLGMTKNVTFNFTGGGSRNSSAFAGTKIGELEMGPGSGDVWFANMFSGCSSLTNIWMTGYPHARGDYAAYYSGVFSGVPANARILLNRESEEWMAWIADTAKATPWKNLTQEQRNAYYAAWPGESRPQARSKSGNGLFPADSWLKTFPWDTGLKLFFR